MTDLLAYVDESARPGRYLMCSVLVDPSRAGTLRRHVKRLLLPGQSRLHFSKEGARHRRQIASALVELEVDASIFVCRSELGRTEADMRSRRRGRRGGQKRPQTQLPTVRTSTGLTSSGPGPSATPIVQREPCPLHQIPRLRVASYLGGTQLGSGLE